MYNEKGGPSAALFPFLDFVFGQPATNDKAILPCQAACRNARLFRESMTRETP
jgi:hypothetical protein